MGRPKAKPPSDSRESPAFWTQMIEASEKRREIPNAQYERYARWHRGDLLDVVDPGTIRDDSTRWEASLDNMTYLATVASMADLFFRYPRFVIRPPYASKDSRFNAGLLRCEEAYLAHTVRRGKLRKRGRRCLQDALLGDMGVMKVTVDSEIVVDEETLDDARKEAWEEITAFLEKGVKMVAREGQIHAVHTDIKMRQLNLAERNEAQLPKSALRYLRKHIRHHERMMGSERPTETIRSSQVQYRRVNLLDYNYDPTPDDREDCSWRSCRYLMRRADVLANDDFDVHARKQVGTVQDRWENRRRFKRSVRTPGSYELPEDMVMIHEVFDCVDQKRRVFADGGEIMLIPDQDRLDLGILQPSGPFHEISFVDDTFEGQGVPPPSSYEGEQSAATHIAAANVAAVTASQGKVLYDARAIDASQAEKIHTAPAAHYVPVDPKGAMDKPLKDYFEQSTPIKVDPQNLTILGDLRRGVDKRSGLGTSKMGGGESSPTATGAALGAEASTSISDDRSATVDEWMEGIARTSTRLIRRFVPKAHIVSVCGPEAIEAYPERWGLADCADDIGVEIIPGSSRRHNTAIDQKQLLDGVTAFVNDPAMQGPAAVSVRIEMYRRYFEDGGVSGLNWSAVEQETVMQAAMMAEMAQGEEDPGNPDGGRQPGDPPDPADRQGTKPDDQMQGVANVGGGRAGKGSIPQRINQQRSEAKASVAERG